MSIWVILGLVSLSGMLGGVVNALVYDHGFVLPRAVPVDTGGKLLSPGWIGNALVGAAAASIAWGLYGPVAGMVIGPAGTIIDSVGKPEYAGIKMSTLASAVLVGVAGARWLTTEVDKRFFRAAAVTAATRPGDMTKATDIAAAHGGLPAYQIAQTI